MIEFINKMINDQERIIESAQADILNSDTSEHDVRVLRNAIIIANATITTAAIIKNELLTRNRAQ